MTQEDTEHSTTPAPTARVRTYSTATAASILQVVPHTLRVSHSMRGGFYGITPIKAPNGRLLWPADAVDAMATGSARAA